MCHLIVHFIYQAKQIQRYCLVAEDCRPLNTTLLGTVTELAQLSGSHSKGQELAVIEY